MISVCIYYPVSAKGIKELNTYQYQTIWLDKLVFDTMVVIIYPIDQNYLDFSFFFLFSVQLWYLEPWLTIYAPSGLAMFSFYA